MHHRIVSRLHQSFLVFCRYLAPSLKFPPIKAAGDWPALHLPPQSIFSADTLVTFRGTHFAGSVAAHPSPPPALLSWERGLRASSLAEPCQMLRVIQLTHSQCGLPASKPFSLSLSRSQLRSGGRKKVEKKEWGGNKCCCCCCH